MGMFLWTMPMPPWRAMAIAKRDSVTVSMAADASGIFRGSLRVKQVRVSVDRKSTRLNSSHLVISYAVFCLKNKKTHHTTLPLAREPDYALRSHTTHIVYSTLTHRRSNHPNTELRHLPAHDGQVVALHVPV